MSKRKIDTLGGISSSNDSKKAKRNFSRSIEPKKAPNLLVDSDSESSSKDESDFGGAPLEEESFKVNEEYAKRFEHNKKREELHRCRSTGVLFALHTLLTSSVEEKYQKKPKHSNGQYGDKYDEDEDSSSDEDEDDEGFLATEALDAQISATLQAIRNKDPRVYDEKVTFYASIEEEDGERPPQKETKPMYLQDYHRENLLNGYVGTEENEEVPVLRTFAQEQDELKKTIVKEMHAAANGDRSSSEDEDGDEDDGFLVPKTKPLLSKDGIHPSKVAKVEVDVTVADKDPETFLSNFMAARAWVPTDGARFQPLESDDDDEEERAEKFEAAYNLRFEDPQGSNEILRSYARDVVAARSVRREEPKGRKKQRNTEHERKEAEKRQREEERARLRRLKIEEMEEKLQKIKKAAGLRGQTLKDEEWVKFLDEGWNDNTWEAEMNRRFGDDYYAQQEAGSEQDSEPEKADGSFKKKKLKKPKWDDDIDITDIIPEFEDEEASSKKPVFTLSDSESEDDEDEPSSAARKSKSSKERKQDKLAKKKAARLEHKKIEELVDSQLDLDDAILPNNSKQPSLFRYRETSPTSFGLTARDILMAPDASLNQFAGLKKMATFRDAEKKRKDKRKLGKKARLREWRRETFGNEDGPEIIFGGEARETAVENDGLNLLEGKGKRKRSKKKRNQGST
jgi:protein KRI1